MKRVGNQTLKHTNTTPLYVNEKYILHLHVCKLRLEISGRESTSFITHTHLHVSAYLHIIYSCV